MEKLPNIVTLYDTRLAQSNPSRIDPYHETACAIRLVKEVVLENNTDGNIVGELKLPSGVSLLGAALFISGVDLGDTPTFNATISSDANLTPTTGNVLDAAVLTADTVNTYDSFGPADMGNYEECTNTGNNTVINIESVEDTIAIPTGCVLTFRVELFINLYFE